MLNLYNTLTREKSAFTPLDENNVRLYVCGPTVYDFAHIGNARPIIVFDMLFRLLRHFYGTQNVTYARNITDVDDKINARAAKEKISIQELTQQTTKQFHQDIAALNVLSPTVEPRATEHIAEMYDLIETLHDKGHAYVAEDHVLFHVASMPEYGALSRRSVDEMEAGARVEVAPYKKDPMDFVLWKPSKDAEPAWPSPCGIAKEGRPGWHIECSAMSKAHLGEVFDIHGGGIDLVFPHHENEIAQSRCAHGTERMAQVWMHNGFLQVEGEKMSKSLGNFITIDAALADWQGEVLRLTMLQTHYRQPINFTAHGLAESKKQLDKWYAVFHEDTPLDDPADIDPHVLDALYDDLNTPLAISRLHALYKEAQDGSDTAKQMLKSSGQFLGLFGQSTENWRAWRPRSVNLDEDHIQELIAARNQARADKDFAEADRIRDVLTDMGVRIKDGPDGTSWSLTGP